MNSLKKLVILMICWLFAGFSAPLYSQTTVNVNISPGTLKDIPDITNITHLTITGHINDSDIAFMRDNIPNLVELDLSEAIIIEKYDETGYQYHTNQMPNSSFINKTSLISVVLPNGLTSIGDQAFGNCSNLTDITLPAGLTYIGNAAFQNCSSLNDINFPAGLTFIGDVAFYNCSNLMNITFPAGLDYIGYNAFYNCSSLVT
jgi:hypothetical protein